MKITLSPVAGTNTTKIAVNNLMVTIDGVDYDLSVVPIGGQAEAESIPFIGVVKRDAIVVRYEYDSVQAEAVQSKNTDDYIFNVTNGTVPSPIVWRK